MNEFRLILGVVLVLWGILVQIRPRFYDTGFGRFFDFTGYETLFGGILIVIGVFFIWTSLQHMQKEDE